MDPAQSSSSGNSGEGRWRRRLKSRIERQSKVLSGRVKSGQRWSGQNRPTDVARDMVLLSHLLLIGQVRFGSPAPWSAFQDVTVV